MRKLGIVIGAIVVLAVIVLAALPFVLDVNKYRPKIQAELEKRTGRSVSFGKMDLKIFPLAFRVENAVIGEDPHFPQSSPFAQAGELLVSAKLMPLIHGDVEVDSIVLKNPKIELIRNQQGVWNFSSLGKTKQQQPAATAPPSAAQQPAKQPAQAQQGQSFSLKNLNVSDGQVALTDYLKKKPRAVYDHIDLGLSDYEAGKPFSVVLAAHLPGQGKQTIQIDGKGGPLRDDNVAASNFKGKLKLDQVSLAGLQRFLNSPALEGMDFTATGTADIDANNGNLSSDGNLTLADACIHGVNVGYPIAADYKVNADLNSDVYNIQKGSLKLGQTPISVSGVFNAGPIPAQLDMKVSAGNASVSEMARLAAAFGVAFNPNMQINGRVDANLTANGATNNPKLNGSVVARELVISGKELPQEVHVTNVNVALTPDAIRSNEFMASTGSTAVKVSFELNNYSANNSTINAAVSAPNAQLGELLNIAKAYGVSAVEQISGSGPVSLDVRVQGPTKNPAQMVYNGTGKLQNASLSIPSLTKPINVKNADLQFTQNSAILNNAAFSIGSTNANGQLTLKGLAPNATPETQFSLSADKIDVAELQQLVRNTPQNQQAPKRASSLDLIPSAQAQAKAMPAANSPSLLSRLVGSGNIQAGSILYDQIQYTNAKSGVKLDHGVIRLEPFSAEVFGGTQTGTIVADTRPAQPTYTISSKLDHVDANKMLSSVSPAKQVLYGLLAANANTSFTAGQSTSEIARSLNGVVNLNLLNGKIAHIDLLNELASIGKFAQSGKQSEPFTNLVKLTGDFKITNGLARTDNLKAVIDGGTVAANGLVNLADQSLNMQMTAVLSKDYSQTVGGTGIGGYLNTALANAKGELVMPVIITGTFSNPHIAPDVQRLAQMKLENLLPSSSNPGALTTGILGGLLGNKGGANSGNNQQQQTGGALQGILGQLSGQGQQNQQNQNQQNQQTPKQQNLPANDNPGTPNFGGAAQPAQKPTNPLDQLLNAVSQGQKKKKATPQQQQPEQPPPPPPPGL
ncbi:MAG: hypothetical protein JWO13_1454 [Acidobacteriales bacterium]|nr:hypothetical protein [Terriglobales bacterium]